MSTHSPSPWVSFPNRALIADANKADIAMVNIRLPEADANALLIAAAPELLKALEAVDKQFEALSQRDWLDQVRAAIRKAKGDL